MSKDKTLLRIRQLGLLAVIRGPSAELTLEMVTALVAGGVKGIEITYTTPDAASVVKALVKNFGDEILLGMGTLTKPAQVDQAARAGAKFIVSPHLDLELAQAMVSSGMGVMIGAFTPSEVVKAYSLGSDVVKIFPGSLAGPKYLKSLRGPLPDIPLMPTGGVSVKNVAEWFAAGAVAVGAGSSLCPTDWAKDGRFKDITLRAKEFVEAVDLARSTDD